MADHVTIFEMGPRDGLQNEKSIIDTAAKIQLVDMLSACGFSKIEVTSFVSAKWVPQMADAAKVLAKIKRRKDTIYSALTPNLQGLDAALAANAQEVAVFASASEGFSQKNINCSIAQSLERFEPVIKKAKAHGLNVRGYVSCITDCPYDGTVSPDQVCDVAARLLEMGCYEISLGDTIGAATPEKMQPLLAALAEVSKPDQLAGHFHDTSGNAISNIATCLHHGLRVFDASIGGLGGCPFAPGAKGNIATEKVDAFLRAQGFETGLSKHQLDKASEFAKNLT